MNDNEIVALFFERNEKSIEQTKQKYGAYCRKIACNILESEEDSRECENDAYNAVWNSIPPARPQNFKAYLAKTVRNISMTRFDYNTAAKRRGCAEPIDELAEIVSGSESTEGGFERGELEQSISRFLKASNESGRDVFVRRYFYAESVSDISQRFGMSESKVKSLLFRMRKKLKQQLEKEGFEL